MTPLPNTEHPSFEDELADAIESSGLVGSPTQDFRAEYSTAYNHACKLKLVECDHCEACGITDTEIKKFGGTVQFHHVISVKRIFSERLDPALIGDPANLIRLCRNGFDCECHFRLGHDVDGPDGLRRPTWAESNPNVREDAAKALSKVIIFR